MDRQEIGLYLSATVRQRGLHTAYLDQNNLSKISSKVLWNDYFYIWLIECMVNKILLAHSEMPAKQE